MSLDERFMAVFEGSDVAHGQTTVGRTKRNGKADAKSFVVREPMTVDRIQKHLNGETGVGAIPIRTDNKCRFGAIDVDDYDLDLQSVVSKVQRLDVPLVVCRSKSGGAHLYLFLNDFEDAELVREYLTELSTALGFSGREIFPKQDRILLDRGDVGNFINLPYHNAETTMRYALGSDGKALTLEQFLDEVDEKRCTLSDLERHTLREQANELELKDYPPCIQRIIGAMGGFDTNRNISLFHAAVAVKKERPDDWKDGVEEFNSRYMNPPLPAGEVTQVQDQHSKKDYGFLCDQPPMKDYCDKELCRQCKYGIGGGGYSMPTLNGMTIMLSDPRVYYVNVDGKRVELSTAQLNNPREFQLKCLNDLQMRPPLLKESDWNIVVNQLLAEATEIEVAPELTLAGQFEELLEEYCTSRIRAMSAEEVTMGKPWTAEGYHYFKISGLEAFLKKRNFTHFNRTQIQEQIKRLNGTDSYTKHLRIKKDDGSHTTTRVWFVPEFHNPDVALEVADATGDIPF